MKSEQKIDYQEALQDIFYHFHFYFYLRKENDDGKIKRFISEIYTFDSQGNATKIYQRKDNTHIYKNIDISILEEMNKYSDEKLFYETFVKGA